MTATKFVVTATGVLAALGSGEPAQFDCGLFQDITKTGQDEGLSLVRDFIQEYGASTDGFEFDRE